MCTAWHHGEAGSASWGAVTDSRPGNDATRGRAGCAPASTARVGGFDRLFGCAGSPRPRGGRGQGLARHIVAVRLRRGESFHDDGRVGWAPDGGRWSREAPPASAAAVWQVRATSPPRDGAARDVPSGTAPAPPPLSCAIARWLVAARRCAAGRQGHLLRCAWACAPGTWAASVNTFAGRNHTVACIYGCTRPTTARENCRRLARVRTNA